MNSVGGSVYISTLEDDYSSLGSSCVRPNMITSSIRGDSGGARITLNPGSNGAATIVEKEVARVTPSDCLACSGCVTSTENVLIAAHNTDLLSKELEHNPKKTFALSISPHARA